MGEIRKRYKTRNAVGSKDENYEIREGEEQKRRRKEYKPHSVALKYSQRQNPLSQTVESLQPSM